MVQFSDPHCIPEIVETTFVRSRFSDTVSISVFVRTCMHLLCHRRKLNTYNRNTQHITYFHAIIITVNLMPLNNQFNSNLYLDEILVSSLIIFNTSSQKNWIRFYWGKLTLLGVVEKSSTLGIQKHPKTGHKWHC